ncbi:hypothetical protein GCM10025869_34060 [Homoserinibacter gongjuensis]|uniref:Uncharacterized protein n=1 Tax=Homoserinibacter gongjuensis TaxID=1162968 RepID=A0ABQ6JX44_9MICO|nr:hypothetical protein GCM10025869_34060 [Homoserinibacter gongjuensis]
MRHQMMGQQHGLRVLQVRTARHHGAEVRLGLRRERVDELHDQMPDAGGMVEQVQPDERRDLVVAAAARTQLAAELGADGRDELALEGEVHVLVFGKRTDDAVAHTAIDHLEPLEHPLQLVVVEEPRGRERPRVGT